MKQQPQEILMRENLIKEGLIRSNRLDDLIIYTYTAKTAGKNLWNTHPILQESRGHIFNYNTGECIACPFPKFFNLNERKETQEGVLPWKNGYEIYEKLDGWLGILYRHNKQFKIATRGSFDSLGAVWATKFLQENHDLSQLPDEVTLIFEIICPTTHIIVNYGTREDLVLLTAYNRHTRKEYNWKQIQEWSQKFGFSLTTSYDKHWLGYCRGQVKTASGDQFEGFVIKFNNGFRIKIKAEDYKLRAYLLQQLTPLGVWRSMENGMASPAIEKMFQEYGYLKEFVAIARGLEEQYKTIKYQIGCDFHSVLDGLDRSQHTRKDFAEQVQLPIIKHKKIMFSVWDDKEDAADRYVMEQIRPTNNILFKHGKNNGRKSKKIN